MKLNLLIRKAGTDMKKPKIATKRLLEQSVRYLAALKRDVNFHIQRKMIIYDILTLFLLKCLIQYFLFVK